jgi:hypothetical protein
MTSYKPISIPLQQNVKLCVDERDLVEDTTMYRHIMGNLIYMTITRPDLSHANTTKATFGCSEAHIDIHKTYFAMWIFL